MRKHETVAYLQYFDFRLTESEAKAWEAGKETLADRHRPIEERRRWFTPSVYSEPRLCRYRDTMQWPPTISFPFNAGFVARERLPIRHYPHRDPAQLARRCKLRAIMMADPENRANWTRPELHHWMEREWPKFITPDDLPELKFWHPGTVLPEYHFTNHLAKPHKRLAQRLAHTLCMPLLDRLRPHWPEEAYPQNISAETQAELETQLHCDGCEASS